MVNELFVGIDVGVSGALACINKEREVLSVADMPIELKKNKRKRVDGLGLNAWLGGVVEEYAPCKIVCVVEQVGAMPRDGAASAFTFGESLGVIRGVLACHLFRTEFVTPVKWKRAFNMLGTDKGYSCTVAKQQLPACYEHVKFKKDHGKADALLMALYGLNHYA